MTQRLLRMLIPAAILAALFAGAATASSMGWIPPHVAFWLWPSLVALVLLGFAVFALLKRSRVLLIPLAIGFGVQILGLFLLLAEVFESSWEPTIYTLLAILLVVVVMLAVWGITTLRARALERKLAEGLAVGVEGNQEQLGRIREDMLQALSLLKRAGRGRNAIYDLPWFLVMGRPAAGKTVAIKNSGLGLPVKKDWVKGVGGTYTCDWFFTNEMIFLDTPGKWVTEGAEDEARKYWQKLLQLLRKYRGRRPLDGLVVAVPADDLLSLSDEELIEQAGNIREVVELIHDELNFRFPVYLLVTKTDLVEGFVDFSSALPAQRRQEILGWSSGDPNRQDIARLIDKGFRTILKRMQSYRLEVLARIARRTQAKRLFLFTEEFRELRDPLITFAEGFFHGDRYHEPPVFRGFYFTSGTQGEGSPLSRAMAGLAQSLGVQLPKADSDGEEAKRSYFLLDLFRELMVKDEGLVGRTAGHWWKQRRNTMLGAFAPAGLAIVLLLFALLSFFLNRGVHEDAGRHVRAAVDDPLVQDLAAGRAELTGENLRAALEVTGRLRDDHRKMTVWSPFRSLGMRRAAGLDETTYAVFDDTFRDAILRPLLQQAERVAVDPAGDCVARLDLLHSVVWLRMGRRFETSDDLGGLERLWTLRPEEARAARDELIRQYVYFERNSSGDASSLLPGFSIRSVAQSIRSDCDTEGATSTLAQYVRFENECRQVRTNEEIGLCYQRLNEVLNKRQIDFERFAAHFQALKSDLERLQDEEPQAAAGLEILGPMDLGTQETSECLVNFEQQIIPGMREYAIQDDMLQTCQDAVAAAPDRVSKFRTRDEILLAQREELKSQAELLEQDMATYSLGCRGAIDGFRNLSFPVLQTVATSFRRAECLPLGGAPSDVARDDGEASPTPSPSPSPASPAPARRPAPSRGSSGLRYFDAAHGVAGSATVGAFNEKLLEWQARLDARTAGFDAAQRAYEENEVRQEIGGYASTVNGNLLRYLEGLRLKRGGGSIADWLKQLASTPEYQAALKPAADLGRQAQAQTEPPYDALQTALRPLVSVAQFSDEKLKEYQAYLGAIAADLERTSDAGFFRTYKEQVASGQMSNNLVAARSWVNQNGGSGLADNRLRDLLMRPLDEARDFVQSDSFLKSQWAELRTVWEESIAGRAPLAGDFAGEPVTEEGLVAMFGGASGAVRRVREAAAAGGLSPAADAWLRRAEAISALLFERDADRLRDAPVRFTIGDIAYDPEEMGNKNQVRGVWLHLGGDEDLKWEGEGNPSRRIGVPFFGDYAYVSGNLAEKRGFLRRTIGRDWTDAEYEPFRVEEQAFAPLRLIAGALEGGSGDERQLVFVHELEWKKATGTIRVNVAANAEGLGALLDAITGGLPAPPADASGGGS